MWRTMYFDGDFIQFSSMGSNWQMIHLYLGLGNEYVFILRSSLSLSLSPWKLSHHDTNFVVTGGTITNSATSDNKVGIMLTLIFQWSCGLMVSLGESHCGSDFFCLVISVGDGSGIRQWSPILSPHFLCYASCHLLCFAAIYLEDEPRTSMINTWL